MKKISSVGFLILCFFAIYCHSVKPSEQMANSILNLRYYFKSEFVMNPGKFDKITIEDSTFLYFNKQRVVMKLPSPISTLVKIETDTGDVYTDSDKDIKRRFKYVYYTKGESVAHLYDVHSRTQFIKVNSDSVWKTRINFPTNILDKKVDSLVDVRESKGVRIEFYVANSKPDLSYPDSAVISFTDALNGIPFSFSEELDKSRKMKLNSILFIYKPYYDSTLHGIIPRREFKYEIALSEEDDFANKLLKGTN